MNSAAPKSKPRPYNNRLREAQAEQTRLRILEAVTELMAEGGLSGLTIAEIAERAGVSEPTLYRHFGNRERLYEALDEHIRIQIGMPILKADSASDIPSMVLTLFATFESHGTLLRAAMQSGLAQEIRTLGKQKRHAAMRKTLAPVTAHLPKQEAHAVAAVYRVLLSWEAWERLTGELGVDSTTAANAVAWALEAISDRLHADHKAKRPALRPTQKEKS